MAKKNKRAARENLIKEVDITKPVTLEMLGTDDDPCFGKLYEPRAKECERCGDCELCAIATGQLSHITRKQIERKGSFKDIEEKEIKSPRSKKEVRKMMRHRIYELAKQYGDKGIKQDVIILDLYGSFCHDGFRKSGIKKYLSKLIDKSEKIKLNPKGRVIWYTIK